jgi:galactokinase
MIDKQTITELFNQYFNEKPEGIVRAPGRVNLIGEHTDYNDGFVFPMAIDRAVWIAFKSNNTQNINIVADDFSPEKESIDLTALENDEDEWLEYVKGMANEIQNHFKKSFLGFDAVIKSDVPIGAGLSSSAALELATAKTIASVNKLEWDPVLMAKLAKSAENNWVGVNCGIMDQLICAVAEKDNASLIDCRDLSFESIPLPKDVTVVIMDTATRRSLVTSAYNKRRAQCESAAKELGVNSLREAADNNLFEKLSTLDGNDQLRARHVMSECQRTLLAKKAMQENNSQELGDLFKQSHNSLKNDFEVTNEALDTIVEIANNAKGSFGARMTGAGFGGCAVALVQSDLVDDFSTDVSERYQDEMGFECVIYTVAASQGVTKIDV